jgi:type VI secretion system secreted protein Hcp
MALSIYLVNFKSKSGLTFDSSNKQKGREKHIPIIAFNHEIVSPRDAASGLPTGKRQHKPIEITFEADRTMPFWNQALSRNDTLPKMTFNFWQNRKIDQVGSAAGTEVLSYTIELTNATVCASRTIMLNNKNPELMRYEYAMEVKLTYQKIVWTWKEGGLSAEDDWETPVV